MARPNPLTSVLFDFDGVCADTEPLGIQLDREAFACFGVYPTNEEMQSLVGTTGVKSIPAVFRHYGLEVSAQEFWARRRDNSIIYRDLPLVPNPGVVDCLTRLHKRGATCALVSTTYAYDINFALNRLGMQRLFDVIITGDMVERYKPEPDPYLAGVAALGTPTNECAVVEDSAVGIHAAKAAGLYTLAYVGGSVAQDTHEADEEFGSFATLKL